MVAALRPILAEFQSDIQRSEHLLKLVKAFRVFAASQVPTGVDDGRIDWHAAVEMAEIAPRVRTDLPILSGSLLLYLCGRFEFFVRELVLALADHLCSQAVVYSDLPQIMRTELFEQTLIVAKSPQRFGYDQGSAEQLLVSLAGNIGNMGSPISVRSEVLTMTESNMTSRMLADMFKRVDNQDVWKEIAKQAPLKSYLEKASDGDCRQEVTRRLDAVMKSATLSLILQRVPPFPTWIRY